MKWTVTFYGPKVEQQTLGLPGGILGNFLRIVELIEEFGPLLGRPHSTTRRRAIRDQSQGARRNRPVGFLHDPTKGCEVVILITVVKKANRIEARHMEIARKHMKEVKER